MHDGSLPTLEAVLDFYDRGGDVPDNNREPLDLTREEKRAVVSFLRALTAEDGR
jgi:cytochrome c peroxidase